MNPKLNPGALAFMWGLTLLMVGAIAIGPIAIYVVSGLVVAYAFWAVN